MWITPVCVEIPNKLPVDNMWITHKDNFVFILMMYEIFMRMAYSLISLFISSIKLAKFWSFFISSSIFSQAYITVV